MEFREIYNDIQSAIRPYADLARPYNSVAALFSFAIGYYFYSPTVVWINFLIGFIVVALIHSAFTMQNDLYDLAIDKFNQRTTPLIGGTIKPKVLSQVITYTIFVALILSWFSSHKLYCLYFIFLYSVLAIAYNTPPIFGSRRPVTSIALLGPLYSTLPLYFGLALSGNHFTVEILIFSILHMLIRISISILKDFKDTKGDRHFHKHTFYLTYGRKAAVGISIALALTGYALLFWAVLKLKGASFLALTALFLAALINITNRTKLVTEISEKGLARRFQKSFLYQHLFDGAILLCLLTS
jgi:4-hydroxybenzoate polyprenyltransferase